MFFQNGLALLREPIETVVMKGTEVSLLSAGDGTEVILHKLEPGARWGMGPQDGWTAFESLVLLSGEMSMLTDVSEEILRPGNVISASPVLKDTVFIARQLCEFLYITSQPVFHAYSEEARNLIELAVAVEEKDGYTAEHCGRIKDICMRIGDRMKLTSNELHHLNFGAFFHDVGKVKVPLKILNKPGKLTDVEWTVMKLHAKFGGEMLQDSQLPSLREAAPIVHYHHERWDGNGYFGLKGEEIPVGACIVAVADSFDAMTTDRVYQKGRTPEEALNEIRLNSGRMYRPDVVETFIDILEDLRLEG